MQLPNITTQLSSVWAKGCILMTVCVLPDMTTPPWCREKVMVYYYYCISIGRPSGLLLFVPTLLFSILTPLFCVSSSVSLSYFILAVSMRECFGKHSCMSSQFPLAILNGTSHLLPMCQSYFIFVVPMRKCLGKHSCTSSKFSMAILNKTSSLRSAKTAIRSVSLCC